MEKQYRTAMSKPGDSKVTSRDMSPYQYIISLGIKHSTSSLKEEHAIFAAIPGIIIGNLREVGTARKDPKGKPLTGKYLESHFGFSFDDQWQNSSIQSLEEALNKFLDKIEAYKDVLQKVTDSGGRLDFFIGLKIGDNSGLILNPALLKRIAGLHIELGLDMYPPDK